MSTNLIPINDNSLIIPKTGDVNELEGRKLYQKNDHYRMLANVLEHPEFRVFLEKYFTDLLSIKHILMYIHLYRIIEQKYPAFTPYEKLHYLHLFLSNRNNVTHVVNKCTKIF